MGNNQSSLSMTRDGVGRRGAAVTTAVTLLTLNDLTGLNLGGGPGLAVVGRRADSAGGAGLRASEFDAMSERERDMRIHRHTGGRLRSRTAATAAANHNNNDNNHGSGTAAGVGPRTASLYDRDGDHITAAEHERRQNNYRRGLNAWERRQMASPLPSDQYAADRERDNSDYLDNINDAVDISNLNDLSPRESDRPENTPASGPGDNSHPYVPAYMMINDYHSDAHWFTSEDDDNWQAQLRANEQRWADRREQTYMATPLPTDDMAGYAADAMNDPKHEIVTPTTTSNSDADEFVYPPDVDLVRRIPSMTVYTRPDPEEIAEERANRGIHV